MRTAGADPAASMRPPEFTGGNLRRCLGNFIGDVASMRPPEFTGGNWFIASGYGRNASSFNEAAGIHRRKPPSKRFFYPASDARFNEAAGIHRRKLLDIGTFTMEDRCFNEAAGIHRRKRRTP